MTLAFVAAAAAGAACVALLVSLLMSRAELVRVKARLAAEINGRKEISADLAQAQEREEHMRLLLNEMVHRSKNTLAVAQVIARQTANTTEGKQAFIERYTARLQAFGMAHTLLLDKEGRGGMIEDVCADSWPLPRPHRRPDFHDRRPARASRRYDADDRPCDA